MKFLITGGAGYIGSTICSALEDAGHTPVILDSLVTGRDRIHPRAHLLPGRYRRLAALWSRSSASTPISRPPCTAPR